MSHSRLRVAALSLLVCGGLVLAGLTAAAPTTAAPAAKDPKPPRIPARYLSQTPDWAPCWFDPFIKADVPGAPTTNCASITVPMDWNAPNAHPDVSLAVAYSQGNGDSQGLLMTNPGGPGGAGLTLSAVLGLSKPRLFSDFDLLGFDPRGFGESTNLQCLTTTGALAALPTTLDYRVRDAQTHRTEIAEARLYAKACSATEFGQFVSTQQTVYDMDFLRALLGYPTTHFLGYSYGTWLGAWYADTYPSRTGRMILDSNMNWVATHYDNFLTDPMSFQRRRDQMFFPWLARHHDVYGLGRTVTALKARYEKIRAGIVDLAAAGGSFPSYALDDEVGGDIYSNTGFQDAADAMVAFQDYVASGDAAELARATADKPSSPLVRAAVQPKTAREALQEAKAAAARSRSADAVVDLGPSGLTVRCNDSTWNTNPWKYIRDTDRFTRQYPFVGYFNGLPYCAFWPDLPARDRDIDLRTVPTILMIQSEGDPATAYEGALVPHRQLPGVTRLVSINDEGMHGQYVGGPSACTEGIGDRFLFTGEPPGADRVCGTSPLPLDSAVYPLHGPVGARTAAERGSAGQSVAAELIARANAGR